MSAPQISILVPVYNRRDVVGEAIASALGQTRPDLEVIVVDDGSTDGTLDVVRAQFGDDRRLVCLQQENGGTASARNLGLERARGTYVGFLDSDDRYLPEFVERQVAALEAAPEAAMALCDIRYVGETRHRWTTVLARRPAPSSIDDMLDGAWFLPAGMLVKARVAKELRFDTTVYVEDTDFLFRFFAAGHGTVVVPQVLAEYVKRGEAVGAPQKSGARMRQREEMLRLQERFASRASHPRAHHVRLHRRWAKYLVESGDRLAARPHAAAWWRARPWSPRAAWMWLRSRAG